MAEGPSTAASRYWPDELVGRIAGGLERRVEIDLRALATFRIAIGLLLVLDLLLRSRHLVAFYTDEGVLPRSELASDVHSLHVLSGEPWAQALLFLLAGLVALAMVVGYRTRIATIASWGLLLSLQARNPMILNAGDGLLHVLLFWAIFLPLGERWAIDARRHDRERTSVASIATMAILVQLILMYAVNGIHKSRSEEWMSGQAIHYVFHADQLTHLLGNVLLEFPVLLRALTYAWLGLVFVAPVLLLLTGIPRAALTTLYVGMHLGMVVSMPIGPFPLIAVSGLLLFYPPAVWTVATDLASRLGLTGTIHDLRRRADARLPIALGEGTNADPAVAEAPAAETRRDDSAVDRTTGAADDRPTDQPAGDVGDRSTGSPGRVPTGATSDRPTGSTGDPVSNAARTVFLTAIPYLFLGLVVLSNAAAVGYADVPDPAETALDTVEMDQNWRMFAPNPAHTTRWFAAPATLEDGTEVDAFHGGAVDRDRPPDVAGSYPSFRWRKYLVSMRFADDEDHRSHFANYLCTEWNRSHETNLDTVTVYYAYERFDPEAGELEAEGDIVLQEYDCSGDPIHEP